jgi:hypothetical protein
VIGWDLAQVQQQPPEPGTHVLLGIALAGVSGVGSENSASAERIIPRIVAGAAGARTMAIADAPVHLSAAMVAKRAPDTLGSAVAAH